MYQLLRMHCPLRLVGLAALLWFSAIGLGLAAQAAPLEEARTLLVEGRPAQAVATLEAAQRSQPNDRTIMQELIRARAALRQLTLTDRQVGEKTSTASAISPLAIEPRVTAAPSLSTQTRPANVAPAIKPIFTATPAQATIAVPESSNATTSIGTNAVRNTPCWAARLQTALQDCEREERTYGASAELLERMGDLYRSLGQVSQAVAAYRRSGEFSNANQRAARKIEALNTLTAEGPPPVVQSAPQVSSVVASTNTVANAAPAEGKTYALLIGNNQYKHHSQLLTAISDTRLLGSLLQERYGYAVETIENASRRQILDALVKLRRRVTAADRVLIYYAGHGIQDETTRRGYWLPVDAETDNIANWIANHDITDFMLALQARHVLVVADSCFSGALIRAGQTANLDARSTVLQRLISRRSRTVITSGGLEPVLDSGAGKHSVFAQALIDALSEQSEPLEAGRLFVSVRERVARAAEQTPQYAVMHDAGHEGGDFVFSPRGSRTQ